MKAVDQDCEKNWETARHKIKETELGQEAAEAEVKA